MEKLDPLLIPFYSICYQSKRESEKIATQLIDWYLDMFPKIFIALQNTWDMTCKCKDK